MRTDARPVPQRIVLMIALWLASCGLAVAYAFGPMG
jgi:hypothetical protein